MAELVDATDSKFGGLGRVGSTPTTPTYGEISCCGYNLFFLAVRPQLGWASVTVFFALFHFLIF